MEIRADLTSELITKGKVRNKDHCRHESNDLHHRRVDYTRTACIASNAIRNYMRSITPFNDFFFLLWVISLWRLEIHVFTARVLRCKFILIFWNEVRTISYKLADFNRLFVTWRCEGPKRVLFERQKLLIGSKSKLRSYYLSHIYTLMYTHPEHNTKKLLLYCGDNERLKIETRKGDYNWFLLIGLDSNGTHFRRE